eukprot:546707-Pyramimonas_sp.AAC.1
MGMIRRLDESIPLNIARGSPGALGSVTPETLAVITVGAPCMDRGFSFVWPAGQRPCLLLSNGHRVDLIVEGKIPFDLIWQRGAGSVDVRSCRREACNSRAV